MADVRDYLELRGDVTLAERPFNDVDALALATLSYLDLGGIVAAPGERGEPARVADACAALADPAGGGLAARVRSLATVDERFVAALGASERLGGALLRDYVDLRDDGRVLQFAAVTIEPGDGSCVVAFRGTDTTLVGWRENFRLSYAVTEAQREAARYLSRALGRAGERGLRVRAVGHSKGGNLAAFAAASCPVALADGIERVWSLDGPGTDPTVMPVGFHEVLGERYVRIVPAYSVVGRLFSDGAEAQVVRSSASRSLQHDPLTWQVGPTGLLPADAPDPECLVVADAFSTWLSRLAPRDREQLTDELFDALAAGGAERFEDVLASPAATQRVLSALGGIDARTRDMMLSLIGEVVGASAAAARDAVARRVADRLSPARREG